MHDVCIFKMNDIIKEVKSVKNSKIKETIVSRLKEFEELNKKDSKDWFGELCFCILTSNSKAQTAINIQNDLTSKGFIEKSEDEIRNTIIKHKHRFHNNKAKYIILAREHIDIKDKITKIIREENEREAREWLVKNIKGLGYKEASHFLRNVGYKDVAILDRHIINYLFDKNMIKEKPKTLNKKTYSEIEKVFEIVAESLKMNLAELDLYLWFIKTGAVLK